MAGVNKVILVGNLGKDPEVRALDNGVKVARFSVATTESYRDKNTGERVDTTEWHNIVLWRGVAEIAEKYLRKGSQVYIEGKLQTRSYEDKDGVTKYSTEVVGQNLTMLGRANENGGMGNQGSPMQSNNNAAAVSAPNSGGSTTATTQPAGSSSDLDDLPF